MNTSCHVAALVGGASRFCVFGNGRSDQEATQADPLVIVPAQPCGLIRKDFSTQLNKEKAVKRQIAASLLAACIFGVSGVAAATCPLEIGQIAHPGESKTIAVNVTGLAFGTYFVTIGQGGGNVNLLNLSATPLPGFTYLNGQKGFNGTQADIYISYFVAPAVQPIKDQTVTLRIINSAGATICTSNYQVHVTDW